MDNKDFKEKVYTPYNEAWSLLKPLQKLRSKATEDNKAWEDWVRNIDKYRDKYSDNPFALAVYKMLLDAGDVIGKMNEE